MRKDRAAPANLSESTWQNSSSANGERQMLPVQTKRIPKVVGVEAFCTGPLSPVPLVP
jgi:hypothetical protein